MQRKYDSYEVSSLAEKEREASLKFIEDLNEIFYADPEFQRLLSLDAATQTESDVEEVLAEGTIAPAAAELQMSLAPEEKCKHTSESGKKPKCKSITGRKFFLDTNEHELVPVELELFKLDDGKLYVTHDGTIRQVGSDATWTKTRRRYEDNPKQLVPTDAELEHREDGSYHQDRKVMTLNDKYNAERRVHKTHIPRRNWQAGQPYNDGNPSTLFQTAEKKPRLELSILSDKKLGI